MEIKAKVWTVSTETEWLKAMASITIDDSIVVKGIKVIEGKNGLFLAMPNRKYPNGEYKDICFPITAEAREKINNTILEEYKKISTEENKQETVKYEGFSDDDLPF